MNKLWQLFLVAVAFAWNVASARPFTASDLVTLRDIGEVTASPDGRWLAWDQREADLTTNQTRTRVWLLDLEHPGEPRPLFPDDDYNVHHARFSADGAWIYFLSDVSGVDQLWRTPTNETAAEMVGDFDAPITSYSLSPTGESVAILTNVSTACNELPCSLPQPVENCCGTGRGFDDAYIQRSDQWRRRQTRSTIYVEHRDEWMMPEFRSRLFVMAVKGGQASSAMGRWLGDVEQAAWSADGQSLFFTLRKAGREERFALDLDIIQWRSGQASPVNLTASSPGVDALPVTSPDGRWLAYVSAGRLKRRDLTSGAVVDIWNGAVRSMAWTGDSRSLLVTARLGMDEPLFQIPTDGGKIARLTTEGRVANVVAMSQGGVIYSLDTMAQPADLYQRSAAGELRRLTAINADRLRDIELPRVERFNFKGAKGTTVSAWSIAPKEHLPTVLLIQDEAELTNGWSRDWNPLLFAAPGYAVMGIDSLALEDLRLGLSAAAAHIPAVDTDNVCIAGNGAYGGYLAYRVAGEWSRQPRCLIANGGVVDALSMSYQTDEPWLHDWQGASQWNPLHRVSAWHTPMLILHGERNFRVPYSQSLVAFTAAQRRYVPSRLVVFPDEGRQVQAPKNTIQWYGEVFNWLDRWLFQRDGTNANLAPWEGASS